MPSDQYTMQDSTEQYPGPSAKMAEEQPGPGLQREMPIMPDAGERTYRGTGRLTGRKAIVTGAASGIGRAVAIAFAREGADIMLSYLLEEEADTREVMGYIEAEGRTAVALPGDLKSEACCQELIKTAVEQLGGVDILANIAGKQQNVPSITELTTEQFDETYRTNVYSVFWLAKAALPHLEPGSSIVTSSVEAYDPSENLLDNAQTKAAQVAFVKSLAKQVAERGVRVNGVAPGPFWTPLQVSGGQPASALLTFGADTPLGRPGQPAELGPVYGASGGAGNLWGRAMPPAQERLKKPVRCRVSPFPAARKEGSSSRLFQAQPIHGDTVPAQLRGPRRRPTKAPSKRLPVTSG